MIQNVKGLAIFFYLQAKLQLFQEFRALFRNFFWPKVERLPKKLYDAAKAGKKALPRPTEHKKLNTVVNMVAIIDIDA